MFRLLGLLAALNLRLNRIRINFIPLNLALAGLLICGVSAGLSRVVHGPADIVPRLVTVADLAAGRVATGSFVRVSGRVEPSVMLELGKRGADGKMRDVRERLQLLHDSSAAAVWLRTGSTPIEAGPRATFIGVVQPLPAAARKATEREGGAIGGRAPSTDCLLEYGTRPRSFGSGLLLLGTCTPPLALLAWVWIRRNQIFRAGQHVAVHEVSPDAPIDLRVSGRLRLDRRTSRRFVEMGAELRWVQGGGIAVLANVDASTYVMGLRAVGREGLWALAIPADAALSVVLGEQAFGGAVRPAARVDVRVGGRVTDRMTLSFGSVGQRTRVLQVLSSSFATQSRAAAA